MWRSIFFMISLVYNFWEAYNGCENKEQSLRNFCCWVIDNIFPFYVNIIFLSWVVKARSPKWYSNAFSRCALLGGRIWVFRETLAAFRSNFQDLREWLWVIIQWSVCGLKSMRLLMNIAGRQAWHFVLNPVTDALQFSGQWPLYLWQPFQQATLNVYMLAW